MSHEDIICLLLWLCYIGWVGAIIFGIGAFRDAKTIREFYEYAKKLEDIIRRLEGRP